MTTGLIYHLSNTVSAKLANLNRHPPEVVSRYRDPQLQLGKKEYVCLNLGLNICNSL